MQAIVTKYHHATASRGPRASATSASGIRVYHECKPDENPDRAHIEAAYKLIQRLDWERRDHVWRWGTLNKDDHRCWIQVHATDP